MHIMTYERYGKRHAVSGDRESLTTLAVALKETYDISADISNPAEKTVSFQHKYQKGDKVWYTGDPYIITACIPGIDVLMINPANCGKDCCSTRVTSARLTRRVMD